MDHNTEPRNLDQATFRLLAALIYEQVGIVLGPQKEALVSARVGKRMRTLGMTDFREYYRHVSEDASGAETVELVDAISTNVTHFFREERHFDFLSGVLADWENGGRQRLRLWCAACSSGEEPYSMAMTAAESLRSTADLRILATDISTRVLRYAIRGEYPPARVDRVTRERMNRHFVRHGRGDATTFTVAPALSQRVTFGRLNLASPPFPMRGPFDAVFCRNVMIYFDNRVRCRLLKEIYRLLRPGGYLIVGHAESLSGLLGEFRPIEPSIYMRPE